MYYKGLDYRVKPDNDTLITFETGSCELLACELAALGIAAEMSVAN